MYVENESVINWLLDGDVSIQFATKRDLLQYKEEDICQLQKDIENKGWGRKYLDARGSDGLWGNGIYNPKWTSTHYTLLDLRNLNISKNNKECRESAMILLNTGFYSDSGINFSKTRKRSDVCVTAMVLNMLCYFNIKDERMEKIVDYLLLHQMEDGGWNCSDHKGAVHSSFHTTLSALESINEYAQNKYTYRIEEFKTAEKRGKEFLLEHRLFKSHRTGAVVDKRMTMLSYPGRWKYDILRSLDYFRASASGYDERMKDALDIIIKKRNSEGKWPLEMKYSGKCHFDMEEVGQPSRWNTLRALRVLKHFNI